MKALKLTAKAAVLCTGAAVCTYTFNRVVAKSAVKNHLTDTYIGNSYHYSQGDINYIKEGSGPPILLLHELSVRSSVTEWRHIISTLAKNNTVYAIDLLGCGHSDRPAITYTSYMYIQIICNFIRDIIKEKTDIIATGLSSAFAVAAKQGFSDLINRIIAISPTGLTHLQKAPETRELYKKSILNLPLAGALIYNIAVSRTATHMRMVKFFKRSGSNVSRETFDIFYENSHIVGARGRFLFNSIKTHFLYADIHEFINSIDKLYIISGENYSHRSSVDSEYADANPGIRFFRISGAGHFPQLECPKKLLKVLLKIL